MPVPLTIVGYSDRLSGCAGDVIEFKVSSRSSVAFDATLVRVIHADANPAGPGLKFENLGNVFSKKVPSREQFLQTGSYARISDVPVLCQEQGFTFAVRLLPTLLNSEAQCLLAQRNDVRGQGFAIFIDSNGITFSVDGPDGLQQNVRCPAALKKDWHDLIVSYMPKTGRVQIAVAGIDTLTNRSAPCFQCIDEILCQPLTMTGKADLLLAVDEQRGVRSRNFNGKLEHPCILSSFESAAALAKMPYERFLETQPLQSVYADWDFSYGIDTQTIIDRGPGGRHGVLHNLPARAVTGSAWNGNEMCWRHASSHYAAIHFHDDDLHDAAWKTDFSFRIPAAIRSGAYAMHIAVDGHEDYLPFYVRPATGMPSAKVLFIAPTYTYQAYANFARGNFDAKLKEKVATWGAYPHNPDEHREYGLSTYNLHSDGSGVYFSSRLRPMLTFRPGFMTFDDVRGSGCRHYTADSHLLDWLEHEGVAVDIVTDEDVQAEGSVLLSSYPCVLTGTHPEYHTGETLDALTGYLRNGGNLAYLGGNGFYWRIGRSDALPGVLEMRRSETGTRAWATPAGEYFHALDGHYSGLWRNSGRPPNQLVGIGFTAQGPFEGSFFRIKDEARNQPGGWMLEGVAGPILGDFGLCGGGAAGFELDSVQVVDGSPEVFTILASSEGHSAEFGVAQDSLLSHTMSLSRGDPAQLIHADMIHYPSGFGGQVFSVGSITFCGALSHNGYRNNVSTLLRNVVTGFSTSVFHNR